MSIWYSENDNVGLKFSYKINDILFDDKSEFQSVKVIDTVTYGRMLLIDDLVMITDRDEFVYHEMISHIPVALHGGKPKNIVVIGGGDGGTVREVVRYPFVEKVVLCEIDKMVVDASKEFFPDVACGLKDPRVIENIGDGLAYMRDHEPNSLDLVIVDSTDPIGPGESLFTGEFYQSVARALKPDGLMVAQAECPWYGDEIHGQIQNNISKGFSNRHSYYGLVPTYPRGSWTWTVASNRELDPNNMDTDLIGPFYDELQYITPSLMSGAFALPKFFVDRLNRVVKK